MTASLLCENNYVHFCYSKSKMANTFFCIPICIIAYAHKVTILCVKELVQYSKINS